MQTKFSKRNLGNVSIGSSVLNDEKFHKTVKHILNSNGRKCTNTQIVHTKVLKPGDFENLLSQYKISDKMRSSLELFDNLSKHVFCDQLGSNLCWRCTREIANRKLKEEIHKDLPSTDVDILPRIVCVENALNNMNLPLYPISEINQWTNIKSDYKDNASDNEPMFFPYTNIANENLSNQSSNVKEYETNGQRHVTFETTFLEDETQKNIERRRSIQFIGPPVIVKI